MEIKTTETPFLSSQAPKLFKIKVRFTIKIKKLITQNRLLLLTGFNDQIVEN